MTPYNILYTKKNIIKVIKVSFIYIYYYISQYYMNYHNNTTYIYESPDNGETIYKRKFGITNGAVIKQTAIRDKDIKKQTQSPDSNLFDNLLSYLQK